MIDWRQGGWTGSIKQLVGKEVQNQLRNNDAYRKSRYRLIHRIVRKFFQIGDFKSYFVIYFLVDLIFVAAEALIGVFAPDIFASVVAISLVLDALDEKILFDVSGYFLATQVGVLGAVALALALVTLIAQRENSTEDIKVYYHESLAVQIVASSIALLAILVIQLLWPFQLLLHHFGFGVEYLVFEFSLLGMHLLWLILNLGAIAYFIATTFQFVQPTARKLARQRYTANYVFRRDLARRLQAHLYTNAANEIGHNFRNTVNYEPTATFGFDYGEPCAVELTRSFRRPSVLYDVRMTWVRWVIRRWTDRCRAAAEIDPSPRLGFSTEEPLLWFTLQFDSPMQGNCRWCKRRGGVRLTDFEKFVLWHSFRFRRAGSGP